MKLRGVISGFGEVAAKGHLPGWLSRPDVSIVAIQDPVAERRHLALRMIKNVRVYDDLGLMLDGEAPDFVDIASPPAMHYQSIKTALDAGAHVLCEKPLCIEQGQLDEVVRKASQKSRVLMCVHNWKHAPAMIVTRHAIASGRLGILRYVNISRLRTEPAGSSTWRSARDSGGGILLDHGWHVFYLVPWFIAGNAPISLSAYLGHSEGGIDNVADIRIAFRSECLASIHLSWCAPVRRTATTIYGDQGILDIDGDRVQLTNHAGATEDLSVKDAPDDSYHSAWFSGVADDFDRAISSAGEGPGARNLEEAHIAFRLMAMTLQSAMHGGAPVDFSTAD